MPSIAFLEYAVSLLVSPQERRIVQVDVRSIGVMHYKCVLCGLVSLRRCILVMLTQLAITAMGFRSMLTVSSIDGSRAVTTRHGVAGMQKMHMQGY